MSIRLVFLILALLLIFLLESSLPYFKGRHYRLKHGFPNITLGSINGIITGFLFSGLTVLATMRPEEDSFAFLQIFNTPFYIQAIMAFVLFDLWICLWHRASHRISFLRRFHRVITQI